MREAIRKIRPKGAVAPLLTHLRRELFHAAWGVLLEDDEFLHAYEHGMVLRCSDGVVRRVYPRIFVYSADYPEKFVVFSYYLCSSRLTSLTRVLIATIRDMGRCPCPRCLVTKDRLGAVGSTSDRQARTDSARHDSEERQQKVSEARMRIYNDGYVVNSDVVENLLKDDSLVPTEVGVLRLGLLSCAVTDRYAPLRRTPSPRSRDSMHTGLSISMRSSSLI